MTELDSVEPAQRLAQTNRIAAITSTGAMTPEQVSLIKATVAKGATDDELRMFIAVAGRTGLDPFTKQIHFIKRWDSSLNREVGAIQTGIDGFRVIAQRSGVYAGQDAPTWCGPDGVWRDVWLSEEPPAAARVAVYRKDVERPCVGVARYKSYVQTRKDGSANRMWTQYDAEMLAKVAEALALRKAFPNDLSGLYTFDEMQQANAAQLTGKAAAEAADAKVNAALSAWRKPADDDMTGVLQASIEAVRSEKAIERESNTPPAEATTGGALARDSANTAADGALDPYKDLEAALRETYGGALKRKDLVQKATLAFNQATGKNVSLMSLRHLKPEAAIKLADWLRRKLRGVEPESQTYDTGSNYIALVDEGCRVLGYTQTQRNELILKHKGDFKAAYQELNALAEGESA